MITKQQIENLIKDGRTYQEIGNFFGISRQRIHQIYKNYHSSAYWFSIKNPGFRSKIVHILKNLGFNKRIYKKYFIRKTGTYLMGRDFVRVLARFRDDWICQGCGKKWEFGQRRFDLHHIDGNCGIKSRKYDKIEDLDILITLCHRCHLNLDSVRRKMSLSAKNRKVDNLSQNVKKGR